MLEPRNCLLVDIGNTRTKYVFADNHNQLTDLSYINKKEDIPSLLSHCSRVVLASVNNEAAFLSWQSESEKRGVPLTRVKTQAEAFGIRCPYQTPAKLGVDRWLCALAVAKRTTKAVAIIDVGTAATCDFVFNGEYLGGWIAPGFDLMRLSLVQNTANVSADDVFPETIEIGEDTEACVNGGCLAMLSGFIVEAEKKIAALSSNYELVLTGGGAQMLAEISPEYAKVEDNLLFKGLALFS